MHWLPSRYTPHPSTPPPPPSPKSLTAALIFLHMVLQRSWITLTQTVDVQDGHQVVQLIVGGEGHGLPHRALRQLSIPQQAEHPVTAHRHRLVNAELTWQIHGRRFFPHQLHFHFFSHPLKSDSQAWTHQQIHTPTILSCCSCAVMSSDSFPVR